MSGHRREYHYRHLAGRQHYVYIVWAAESPLYVGMTCNWSHRMGVQWRRFHPLGATHIDVWQVSRTRSVAEALEAQAIQDLDPEHNVIHSPRHPDWNLATPA